MITGYPGKLGDKLITHPEIAMISFTGGVTAAKHIAGLAADSLKRTALELVGSTQRSCLRMPISTLRRLPWCKGG